MRKILSIFLIMTQLSQPVIAEQQVQDLVINTDFQNQFKEYYAARNAASLGGLTAGGQTNEFISFLVTVQQKAKNSETKATARTLLEAMGVAKLLQVYNKYYDLPSSRKYIEKHLKTLGLLEIIKRYQGVEKTQNNPSFMRRYPRLTINLLLLPIVAALAEKEVAGTAASFKQLGVILARTALKNDFLPSMESALTKIPHIGSFASSIVEILKVASSYYVRQGDADMLQRNLQGVMDRFVNSLMQETGLSFRETVLIFTKNHASHQNIADDLDKFSNYGQKITEALLVGKDEYTKVHKELKNVGKRLVTQLHTDRTELCALPSKSIFSGVIKFGKWIMSPLYKLIFSGVDSSSQPEDAKKLSDSVGKIAINLKNLTGQSISSTYEFKYDDSAGKQVVVTYQDLMKGVGSALSSPKEAVLANLVKVGGVIALTSFLSSILYYVGNFAYDLRVLFQDRHHAPHNKKLNSEIYNALRPVYTKTPRALEVLQNKSKAQAPITLQVEVKKQPPKWRRWLTWGTVAVAGTVILAYLTKSQLTTLKDWYNEYKKVYNDHGYQSLEKIIQGLASDGGSPATSDPDPQNGLLLLEG